MSVEDYGLDVIENMIWRVLRLLRRSVAGFIANWLEQQGGFPLFTVEGDEPEPADLSWDLPRLVNKSSSLSGWHSQPSNDQLRYPTEPNPLEDDDDDDTSVPKLFKRVLAVKVFACLDLQELEELYSQTNTVSQGPDEVLFRAGDMSESGLYIVVEGSLNVFCQDGEQRVLTDTLKPGESVGEMDLLDGGPRSISCAGGDTGAQLVQLPQSAFLSFVNKRPRALQTYLQKAVGRFWRVAHFVLADVLDISPEEAVQSWTLRSKQVRAPPAWAASANSCATPREGSNVSLTNVDLPCCVGGTQTLPSMERSLSRSLSSSWSTLAAERSMSLDALQSKPSLNRMVSISQRGPRFRPELTSVAESRQDAEEMSDCSSLRSGSTAGQFSREGNGDLTGHERCPPQDGEVGQSLGFSSPFEAVSRREAPLDSFEEDGVHVSSRAVPSNSLLESRRSASMQSQAQSLMADPSSTLSSIDDLESSSISTSALSLARSAEEVSEFPQVSSDGAVLCKHESVSTEASVASSHISMSPFYQVQHHDTGGEDGSVRGYLSAASSLGEGGMWYANADAAEDSEKAQAGNDDTQEEDERGDSSLPTRVLSLRVAQHAAQRSSISTLHSGVSGPLKRNHSASGDNLTWSAEAGELAVSSVQAASGHESELDNLPLGVSPRSLVLAPENLLTAEARRSIVFGQKPGEQRPEMGQIVTEMARSGNRLQAMMSLPPQLLQSTVSNIIPHRLQESDEEASDEVTEGPCCLLQKGLQLIPHISKPHAALAGAWDVLSCEECSISTSAWKRLCIKGKRAIGQHIRLDAGSVLHATNEFARHFYIVLEGHLLAERPCRSSDKLESALITPGSAVCCAAFISSTQARMSVTALESCSLAAFAAAELEALLEEDRDTFIELLLGAARALGPVIRSFVSLGLSRQWLSAGSVVFRQGEEARSLYMVISGRLRILREDLSKRPPVVVEDEASRGETVGAVLALSGGAYDTTAFCVRDTDLVQMSKGAFEVVCTRYPKAATRMLAAMAKKLATASAARTSPNQVETDGRGGLTSSDAARVQLGAEKRRNEIVTIALLPAGSSPSASAVVRRFGMALKTTLEDLFGPTLHLMPSTMAMTFPADFEKLSTRFYRSKITSWMASQEEDYRFIILEGDATKTNWSRVCVSHADCILLVGYGNGDASLNDVELDLVWVPMGPLQGRAESLDMSLGAPWPQSQGLEPAADEEKQSLMMAKHWAARMRRVELVLVHPESRGPLGTGVWLGVRPQLQRHHHVRLSRPLDLARVARWMAGKAIGVVLSGGGSRGLAHLGVLQALDSAGIPIDVIGGTSQGAFMAALYAQGLTWEQMKAVVREYAAQMGSVSQLLSDITLPLISLFSGAGFDRVVRESLSSGPQFIEDLWLSFFCMTTNLTKGRPTAHDRGLLWKLVRASMTIVGLVPPVYEEGELLIDGGYLNNIPIDVMRSMGVDMVVVVDVEDKDTSIWQNLSPYEGGISGWRLLWDRWCPLPSLRSGIKLPGYNQMISTLTWMSHTQNLRRMSREYLIDLYLHPPVSKFKILDYHLMDRIVRDSNRYAWAALSEWQVRRGVTQKGMYRLEGHLANASTVSPSQSGKAIRMQRSYSVACMTQLQAKQLAEFGTSGDGRELLQGQTQHSPVKPVTGATTKSLTEAAAADTERSTQNDLVQHVPQEPELTEDVFWDCTPSGDSAGQNVCWESQEEQLGPHQHASMTTEQGLLFSSMRMVGFAASGVLKSSPHAHQPG